MSLKEAEVKVANQLTAAFKAERDLNEKANESALSGSSPVFSIQLWRAAGLSPKLMGERRVAFLRREEEAHMLKQGLVLVPNTSRGARAHNRASRQRYTAVQEEANHSPKCWKISAIAEYEKLTAKSEARSRRGSQGGDGETQSSGKRTSSTSLSVLASSPPSKKPAVDIAGCPKAALSSPTKGSSKAASPRTLQVKVNSTSSPREQSDGSACVHCKELMGPKGCGKPLVNCRDCGQVMHFDCYVKWNDGAEPGPWDVILCPAHKPAKRVRYRGSMDENVRPSHKRSASQSPRGSNNHHPLLQNQAPIKRVVSSSPRALKAADAKLRAAGDQFNIFSNKGSNSPSRSPSSPEGSNASSDATHLSPSISEDGLNAASAKMAVTEHLGGLSKPNDEELAMQLHRELNSVPTRRARR